MGNEEVCGEAGSTGGYGFRIDHGGGGGTNGATDGALVIRRYNSHSIGIASVSSAALPVTAESGHQGSIPASASGDSKPREVVVKREFFDDQSRHAGTVHASEMSMAKAPTAPFKTVSSTGGAKRKANPSENDDGESNAMMDVSLSVKDEPVLGKAIDIVSLWGKSNGGDVDTVITRYVAVIFFKKKF